MVPLCVQDAIREVAKENPSRALARKVQTALGGVVSTGCREFRYRSSGDSALVGQGYKVIVARARSKAGPARPSEFVFSFDNPHGVK